jgi:uncharacterized membrane protein YdbT with pleckstrin-like domain
VLSVTTRGSLIISSALYSLIDCSQLASSSQLSKTDPGKAEPARPSEVEKMKYVERSLTEGEHIVYTTRRHWVLLVGPGALAAVLAVAGIALLFQKDFFWIGGAILLAVAAGIFISALVRRYGFEFAVTNKRVIYCKGIASISTDELFLDKIESVLVTQGLLGRWWGYGSVSVRGTGGSWEPFSYVADPLLLRRRIQEQIENRSAPVPA